MARWLCVFLLFSASNMVKAQLPLGGADKNILSYTGKVSAARIENDIRTLAGFGTRHTLSDTISGTRGIGAARRWIYDQFTKISFQCGGCLEVSYQYNLVKSDEQIKQLWKIL